jgi:hypothetical protein
VIVLAYLGSQCIKFHAAGRTCWFFASFYLESCICPHEILRWIGQLVCNSLSKGATETLAMIRQAFGEESMSRTRKVNIHRDWKKAIQVKSKFKSMLIIFSDIKGIVHKEFAKQSISHTTVMFYSDYLNMCEDFAPNFGDKGPGYCITTTHHLTFPLSPENFWPKQHYCRPPPTLPFSISSIVNKTEIPPFWRNWGDRGRFTSGAEHPHMAWLPGCI